MVFLCGTADDGRPYLVMKYYPPPNLAMRARAERFSVEDVLRTGIQLASAAETAHRAHITHRDIKPANVLISAYGAPGLTDFGIAGRGAREGDVEAETTDDVGVSVPWAPPEVLYGQSNGDERSDVYSLAATLWQLLVGRSPFEVPGGDNSAYALMPRIRSTAPPATGRQDVPAGLERLLSQAMAKDPAHRPASALELARALQAVEQQQRLGRTPIVVLDEQGHTTLVSQTQGSPTGRAVDDEDRTRVKAPQTVVAQPAPPSLLDDETRRRPDAGAPRWSPAPMPGSSRVQSAAPVRPAAVTDPRGSRPAPLAVDSGDQATVRRPASSPAAQGSRAAAAAPTSSLTRPSVVWGLVGGVAVLAGVLLLLVLRPGEDDPLPAQTRPSATVSMPGDDSAIGDGVFDKPIVSATSGRGSVGFTWNYPQASAKDTYRLSVGPTARDAANPDRAKLVPVTSRTFTVKAA